MSLCLNLSFFLWLNRCMYTVFDLRMFQDEVSRIFLHRFAHSSTSVFVFPPQFSSLFPTFGCRRSKFQAIFSSFVIFAPGSGFVISFSFPFLDLWLLQVEIPTDSFDLSICTTARVPVFSDPCRSKKSVTRPEDTSSVNRPPAGQVEKRKKIGILPGLVVTMWRPATRG